MSEPAEISRVKEAREPTIAVRASPAERLMRAATTTTREEKEWTHGLFSCFSGPCRIWVLALFCPCVSFGEIEYRLGHPEDPHLLWYNEFNGICCMYSVIPLLGKFAWLAIMRTDIREAHNIKGSPCLDCVVQVCDCCSIVQMHRQMEKEADDRVSQAKPVFEEYLPRQGMLYQPPGRVYIPK